MRSKTNWQEITLRSNSAVESITLDEDTFLDTLSVRFQDIDSLDWVLGLTLWSSILDCKKSIDNHVGEEFVITTMKSLVIFYSTSKRTIAYDPIILEDMEVLATLIKHSRPIESTLLVS